MECEEKEREDLSFHLPRSLPPDTSLFPYLSSLYTPSLFSPPSTHHHNKMMIIVIIANLYEFLILKIKILFIFINNFHKCI